MCVFSPVFYKWRVLKEKGYANIISDKETETGIKSVWAENFTVEVVFNECGGLYLFSPLTDELAKRVHAFRYKIFADDMVSIDQNTKVLKGKLVRCTEIL